MVKNKFTYLHVLIFVIFTGNLSNVFGKTNLCCELLDNDIKIDSFIVDELGLNYETIDLTDNNEAITSVNKSNSKKKKEENKVVVSDFEYDNKLIKVHANVHKNKKSKFILDSGAPTLITTKLANELALNSCRFNSVFDAAGSNQEVCEFRLHEVDLSGKKYKNVKVLSNQNVDEMPIIKDKEIDGLLGANVMNTSIWMVNFKSRKIVVTQKINHIKIPANAYSTPLKIDEVGRPVIDVYITEKTKNRFIIDFGYNGSVLVPEHVLDKPVFNETLTIMEDIHVSAGFTSAVNNVSYKFLNYFKTGNLQLNNIKTSSIKNGDNFLIGNEFLENYTIILDFINKQMILIPNGIEV